MADTAIAYSESGVGKTTICCSLAKMIYEQFGLTTRLISVEGWEPVANEGLVEAGIVQPFNLLSRPHNKILSTMRKLSRGWWPKVIRKDVEVYENGVATGEIKANQLVREIVEDKQALDKVGLYFIETLDNICNKFMSILIQEETVEIDHQGRVKVKSIGPQGSSGRYSEDGEVFGGNSEGHYNISQVEAYNLMTGFSSLIGGVKLVFWTSHIGKGLDKKTGESCYCPALVGTAKNSLVPSWVGDCFHLENQPEVWDQNGNKIQDKLVKAYYVNHRDTGLMEGPQYLCKSRVGPSSVGLLEEKFPGGFIPLGVSEGEGLDQYYRWLSGIKGNNLKEVQKWKKEMDDRRK